MEGRDKARCHTAYKGRILTRSFCRLAITFDCRGRACLPFQFPSLDLFEDRHDHRHGNRREQRCVDGILVLIGLIETIQISRIPRSLASQTHEIQQSNHIRIEKRPIGQRARPFRPFPHAPQPASTANKRLLQQPHSRLHILDDVPFDAHLVDPRDEARDGGQRRVGVGCCCADLRAQEGDDLPCVGFGAFCGIAQEGG